MVIQASTGNLGIGIVSPSQKLHISGNTLINGTLSAQTTSGVNWISGNTSTDMLRITQVGTGNAFVVEDSTNPDSTPFVIDNIGDVGIGTTNPTRMLTVSGDSTFIHNPIIRITASTEGYGDVVTFGTGSLTAGNLYYFTSGGAWALADADAESTSTGLLGIALGVSATTGGVLIRGYARSGAYSGGTIGGILYVSTTAGLVTQTAPSATGDVIRIVGYQIDVTNDIIYFDPSKDWILL